MTNDFLYYLNSQVTPLAILSMPGWQAYEKTLGRPSVPRYKIFMRIA